MPIQIIKINLVRTAKVCLPFITTIQLSRQVKDNLWIHELECKVECLAKTYQT